MVTNTIINESAISYTWLRHQLGLTDDATFNPVSVAWNEKRKQMLAFTPQTVYLQDWISDFWLVKGAKNNSPVMLSPNWEPPEQIDDWPQFELQFLAEQSGLNYQLSSNKKMQDQLRQATYIEYDHYNAVERFMMLSDGIQQQADTNMKQKEHVRAWLATAIGHLLMAVTLSPKEETYDLVKLTIERLQLPLATALPQHWTNEFEERRIEWLYNKRMTTNDRIVSDNIRIRVGQGEEWREHWGWLSSGLSSTETLGAVQLAACLMRCPQLIQGLLICVTSNDDYLRTMSLVVIRRLLLTLKTMTWLEEALTQNWTYTRPQDISCFAFNAIKPDWPHRIFGISHRSADIKSALIKTDMWRSWTCAIDANYVPSWETNTGMMWGLFAPAPVIARVNSENYRKSTWCLREDEITEYLRSCSDFLDRRVVFDLDPSQINLLDEVVTRNEGTTKSSSVDPPATFPPLCSIWMVPVLATPEINIMRASAALRLMRIIISDSTLTNMVAYIVAGGNKINQPAPTNNADGWESYAEVFGDLAKLSAGDGESLAIRLPAPINPEQMWLELELSQRIPDLSKGMYSLKDLLVAYEWLLIEWPLMIDERRGDFLIIDCRDITREQWTSSEALSLLRGIASLRTPGPLWFIQRAGQDVENWPFVGERPIFTEHIEGQFSWMFIILLSRSEMFAQYPANSGLELSAELIAICKEGIVA